MAVVRKRCVGGAPAMDMGAHFDFIASMFSAAAYSLFLSGDYFDQCQELQRNPRVHSRDTRSNI
jgi:hypothetical protein